MGNSYRSRVSSKGQLVIPSPIRKRFGFKPGTEVVFTEDKGRLILARQTFEDILKLRGALKSDGALDVLEEERKRERKRLEWLDRL